MLKDVYEHKKQKKTECKYIFLKYFYLNLKISANFDIISVHTDFLLFFQAFLQFLEALYDSPFILTGKKNVQTIQSFLEHPKICYRSQNISSFVLIVSVRSF